MEKERLTRKQIIPIVIGVLTLVILVTSATYAYFSVTAGNSSGTTTITGDIGGDTIGSVTLAGGNTELYLGVSAYDMSEIKKGTTYYSSTTEGSRETNINNAGKTTYTATLSGDETDSVMYACDYEFTISKTGNMPGNALKLVMEGDIDQTISLYSNTTTISGTFRMITSTNPKKEFSAYLQLDNTNSNQNYLAGKTTTIEITNTKWKCYLSEIKPADFGEAYAIFTGADDSTLRFVRSETPYSVGDTYNGLEITNVYTGFEDESYANDIVPWDDIRDSVENVIFVDEIVPISTASWFEGFKAMILDVRNLNTSNVTDMSDMFEHASFNDIDLSTFDTSKVTNMSGMFWATTWDSLNISNWDVSNVINMSGMFDMEECENRNQLPASISNWDTSNVTDMSFMFAFATISLDLSDWYVEGVTDMRYMFGDANIIEIGDISNWRTGRVKDMSDMFYGATLNVDLDLSSWYLRDLESYQGFNDGIKGAGTLTPPTWPTT